MQIKITKDLGHELTFHRDTQIQSWSFLILNAYNSSIFADHLQRFYFKKEDKKSKR